MVAVCWKLLVPALTVVALHRDLRARRELHRRGGFMPFGWKGVFVALSSGGVIFACLGFEQAVQLGGESRNPRRNIPLAIIGGDDRRRSSSTSRCRSRSSRRSTRRASRTAGAPSRSPARPFGPFAALATALGLGWLAVLLYSDAIVSPGGTGLLYTGASARLTFALARNGHIPRPFARLTPSGTPLFAIAFSFLCGLVLFLPFPGWQQLVGFISGGGRARVRDGAARARSAETPGP